MHAESASCEIAARGGTIRCGSLRYRNLRFRIPMLLRSLGMPGPVGLTLGVKVTEGRS